MIIDAEKLSKHLRAIYCDGAIGEVVLHGCFEARAITVDQSFMLKAGRSESTELLPCPIGVNDLASLIQVVEYMAKGSGQIILSFDPSRQELVVACEGYGVIHLVTANPWNIGTACDDATFELIEDALPDGGGGELRSATAQELLKLIRMIKPTLVGLRLSANYGRIGMEGDYCYAERPYDFSWWSGPDCWIWLRTKYFAGILKQVDYWSHWTLCVDGPDGLLTIRSKDYLYIMSPEDADPNENRRWEERCSKPGARNQPIKPSPLLLAPATADVVEVAP